MLKIARKGCIRWYTATLKTVATTYLVAYRFAAGGIHSSSCHTWYIVRGPQQQRNDELLHEHRIIAESSRFAVRSL